MKVTSRKTLDYPELGWGIHAGETRELPQDKKAQEIILSNQYVTAAGETEKVGTNKNKDK